MNRISLIALGAALLLVRPVMAETTEVKVDGQALQMARLKPGVHRYLRYLIKDGEVKLKVYRFQPDAIVGEPGIEGNLAQDYRVASPEPMFNFLVRQEDADHAA